MRTPASSARTFFLAHYLAALVLVCSYYCSSVLVVAGQDYCNNDESILQVQRELQAVSDELGLCKATSMAVETRESMLKQQIGDLERQQQRTKGDELAALQANVSELQEQLRQAASAKESETNAARELFQKERNALQQTIDSLHEQLKQQSKSSSIDDDDSLLQLAELKKLAITHAEDIDYWKRHTQQLEAQLQVTESQNAQLQTRLSTLTAESSQRAIADALQQQQQAVLQEAQLRQIMAAAEIQTAIQAGLAQAKLETAARVQFLHQQNRDLSVANKQLLADSKSFQKTLDAVQAELFQVRREWHATNEKIRAPELRRRLLWKSVQEKWETVVEQWDNVWAVAQPYVAPVWDPVAQTAAVQWDILVKERWPVWKQHATAFFDVASEQAAQLWLKVKTATEPHTDQLWSATEEPRLVLAASYRNVVEPQVAPLVRKLQAWHATMNRATADVLYVATDVALQHCGGSNSKNPVARGIQIVHDHTFETVHNVQLGVVAFILAYLLFGRGRGRRDEAQSKVKVE